MATTIAEIIIVYLALFLFATTLAKSAMFFVNRRKNIELFKKIGIPCTDTTIWRCNFGRFKGKVIHEELIQLAQEYGPLCAYFLADKPCVVVSDSKLTKQIFIDHQARLIHRVMLPLSVGPLSESVLFSSGSVWKRQRKLIQPAFSRYRIEEKGATAHLDETIDLMINYLESRNKEAQKSGDNTFEVVIYQLMKSTAYHLIGSMALNMKHLNISENEAHVEKLDSYLDVLANHGGIVEWVIRIPLLARLIEFVINYITAGPFMAYLFKGINERIDKHQLTGTNEESIGRVPLLDALIKLYKDGTLSRTEVQGNALAILIAGYDTTSTMLAYLFWSIAKHNHIQERLYCDLLRDGVSSDYLEAVIYETARMYNVLPTFVARYLEEPMTIDTSGVLENMKTVTLPAGCTIIHSSMMLGRDSKLWPNVNQFKPDRFMESSGKLMKKIPDFFAPFGFGLRKCLGQHLAMTEMKLVLVSILLRYKLKLVCPEKLNIVTHATFLSKPKDEIRLMFNARQ